MGKRSRKETETMEPGNIDSPVGKLTPWNGKAVDAGLAALFASSAGPVQAPPKSRYTELSQPKESTDIGHELDLEGVGSEDQEDEELSSIEGDIDDVEVDDLLGEESDSENESQLDRPLESAQKPERKRKRKSQEEDLEGKYMQKLMEEEEREEAERVAERKLKRQRLIVETEQDGSVDEEEAAEQSGSDDELRTISRVEPSDIPLHETLLGDDKVSDLEKSARTVFLANVSTSAISSKSDHKVLMKYLASFLSDLPAPPEGKPPHKLESLRFRSTPFAAPHLPKKASFAMKDIRQATTKSTNAYAVYSSTLAAREAVKHLNGTVILDRHLRADGVAHPAKTDHKRCVFVGNLGFVDDESMLEAGENERKRSKIPSDVEEGLWRQFGKAGKVESVRVVRDEKTRVGKGFAYVQFVDPNAVEAALLFNDKKFPPMLPRVLRVVRAKPPKSTALAAAAAKESRKQNSKGNDKNAIYNPKVSSETSSFHGRAGKLLGKAGASKMKKTGANGISIGGSGSGIDGIKKTPEKIIFEGHRASSAAGKPNDLKMSKKKGGGRPKTKGARRAAAWKKSGRA